MLVPYVSPHETVSNLLSLYRTAWEEAGHGGQERIQLTIHCYLADDIDEARAYFEDYRAKLLRAVEAWSARRTPEYPGYEHLAAAVHKLTYDVALDQGKLLVGDPDQVVGLLRQLLEWYGDFEPSLIVNFGNMPIDRAQRTLDVFARRVRPAFQ
jgi:alkanesulfonate monooxygenase SsuD/methylene tetrahydromethanopterin reductase-like flavin-dependent oxidoreductase (luciferase family)